MCMIGEVEVVEGGLSHLLSIDVVELVLVVLELSFLSTSSTD